MPLTKQEIGTSRSVVIDPTAIFVSLQGTGLYTFPQYGLDGITALITFDISYNNISLIDIDYTSPGATIETLDLSHNAVTTLQDTSSTFTSLVSMKEFFINNNQLVTFPLSLTSFAVIETIDASNNLLTSFTTLVGLTPTLKLVNLSSNPFSAATVNAIQIDAINAASGASIMGATLDLRGGPSPTWRVNLFGTTGTFLISDSINIVNGSAVVIATGTISGTDGNTYIDFYTTGGTTFVGSATVNNGGGGATSNLSGLPNNNDYNTLRFSYSWTVLYDVLP